MGERRILIIDDDPSVLRCYELLFRRHGYEPFLAPNGRTVEEHLEDYRDVKAVILDYRMPGMNGLELLRRLRSLDFRAGVLLVSAQTSPEMIEEARRLGVEWIFSKPVDSARLLRAVGEAVARPVREAIESA